MTSLTKTATYLLTVLIALTAFCSCADDDDMAPDGGVDIPARRTIIAYLSGDNNLSMDMTSDIAEMVEGSKSLPADCNLIVFADLDYGRPYIARIANGKKTMIKEYAEDFYCVAPDTMRNIMQWIADHYPAQEYALIMSGHGNGIAFTEDTIPDSRRMMSTMSLGVDGNGGKSGSSYKLMNHTQFKSILQSLTDHEGLPLHLSYIFFDCCCMQSVEIAYELRNVTDYIIGSPAEIPAHGAPYDKLMSSLALSMEQAPKEIVKTYEQYTQDKAYGGICLAAVKTSAMQQLAIATRTVLEEIAQNSPRSGTTTELSTQSCIYYFVNENRTSKPVYHDIRNVMLRQTKLGLLSDDTYRNIFLPALQQAVTYSTMPNDIHDTNLDCWISEYISSNGFRSFYINNDTYSGISISIPQQIYEGNTQSLSFNLNASLRKTQWYDAVGWNCLGW